MKRFIRSLPFLILSFCVIAQTALARQQAETLRLTLSDAISLALQNNRDVLISREGVKRALQQVREARSTTMPSLKFETDITRTLQKPAFFLDFGGDVQKIEIGTDNSFISTITAEQLLYSGGQVSTAIAIARSFEASAEELIYHTEKNTAFTVKQQFYKILLNREVLRVTRRNLEQAQAHLDHLTTLYKSGIASEFEMLRASVQVANVLPRVLSAENDIVLQEDLLKNTIGIPLETEIDIKGELKPEFIKESLVEDLERSAYYNRNDYKNLELTRETFAGRVKYECSSLYPQLRFNYNYQLQGQSNTFEFGSQERVTSQNASINLSFPLFDGFQASARSQQAKIDVSEVDFRLLKLKEAINIQFTEARHNMNNARQRIESLAQTVIQAQKAYDIAQVRYNSGQGTQLELFDAQIALEVAELNTYQSIYDYEISKAQWYNAVGQ